MPDATTNIAATVMSPGLENPPRASVGVSTPLTLRIVSAAMVIRWGPARDSARAAITPRTTETDSHPSQLNFCLLYMSGAAILKEIQLKSVFSRARFQSAFPERVSRARIQGA